MARDLEQLYDMLDRADKAGDKAAINDITQWIKEEKSGGGEGRGFFKPILGNVGTTLAGIGRFGEENLGVGAGLQQYGTEIQDKYGPQASLFESPTEAVPEIAGSAVSSIGQAGAGAATGFGLGLLTGPAAPIAAPALGLVGGLAPGFFQNYEGIREAQEETGIGGKGSALAGAVAGTALEKVLPGVTSAGRQVGAALTKQALKEVEEQTGAHILKDVAKSSFGEGAIEGVQYGIERGASGQEVLAEPMKYAENVAGGAIGGALAGPVETFAQGARPAAPVDPNAPQAPGGPTTDDLMGGPPDQPPPPTGPGTQAYEDEKSKLDGMIHDLKAKIDAAKETNPENAKSAVVKAWQAEMKASQAKLSEIADLELADQFPDDPSAQRVKAEILLKRQQQKELEANPVPDKLPPGGPKDAQGAKTTDLTGAERQAGPFTGRAGEATVGYNNAEARKMYEQSDKTPPVSTEGLEVKDAGPVGEDLVAAKKATTNEAPATGAPLPDVAAEKEMAGTIDISDEYEALSKEAKKDREYNTATQILDGITGKAKLPEVRVLKESKPVEMEPMQGEVVNMEGDNVQRDTGIDVGEFTPDTLADQGEQIDLSGEMTPTELELGKVEPVTAPLNATDKINPFAKKTPEPAVATTPDAPVDAKSSPKGFYIQKNVDGEQVFYGPYATEAEANRAGYFTNPQADRDAALTGPKSTGRYRPRGLGEYDANEVAGVLDDPGAFSYKGARYGGKEAPVDPSWNKFKKEDQDYLYGRDNPNEKAPSAVVGTNEKAVASPSEVIDFKNKMKFDDSEKAGETNAKIKNAVTTNNLNAAMDILAQGNIFSRHLAKIAKAFNMITGVSELTMLDKQRLAKQYNAPSFEYAAGIYDPNTDTVQVDVNDPSNMEWVFGHEVAHGLTHRIVEEILAGRTTGFTYDQVRAAKQLEKMFHDLKSKEITHFGKKDAAYGMKNLQEFVSEAFTNPKFQATLAKIPYANTTVWGAFTKMVARILGLKRDNAFTEFLSLQEMITNPRLEEHALREKKYKDAVVDVTTGVGGKGDIDKINAVSAFEQYKKIMGKALRAGTMTLARHEALMKQGQQKADSGTKQDIEWLERSTASYKTREEVYDKAIENDIRKSYGLPPQPAVPAGAPNPTPSAAEEKINKAASYMARSYRAFADILEASPIPALQKLGVGVRNYVDSKGKYEGQVRTRLRPGLEALRDMRRRAYLSGNPANITKANEQITLLGDFFRHRDWGRTADARQAADKLGPEARLAAKSIIDAFGYVGKEAVDIGVLMKQNGKVVPFKQRKDYFPRIVSHEYANAMRDPFNKKNAKQVDQIADWMIKNGKAKDKLDAMNKMNDYSNGVRKLDDFHGNLERSRNDSMPEFIYDYSVDAAKQYLNLSTERLAQISGLGQTIGSQQTLFDQAMKSGIDNDTKEHIVRGAGQIYGHNIETMETISHSPWTNAFNSFVTGSALGSPFASSTNLIGGIGNIAMVLGARKTLWSIAKDLKDYNSLKKLGDSIGLTPDDVMNMHDTFSVIESGKGAGNAVGRFMQKHYADKLLTINGFKLAEKWNRIGTLIVARAELQDALLREKNGSRKASQRLFKDRLEREGIDWDKLKAEGGEINGDPNSETAKYYRKLSNLMQGSYQVDQIPLYVNSPVGRLFFKFWKFNTQQTRLIEREFIMPLLDAIEGKKAGTHDASDVALRTANLISGLAKAGLTGVGISASRLALNPKTELARVVTAAGKGELGEAAIGALYALVAGMFAEGTLGLASMLGETAEWAYDNFMEDDISTKGLGLPMMPASAGTVENVAILINDIAGAETQKDYEEAFKEFGKKAIRIVRDGPKIADWIEGKVQPDSPDGKAIMAQKNRLDAQKYIQDYMEANDIKPAMNDERNFWQKVFGLPPTYEVKNKELKKNVREKIEQGDPDGAKALMDEALEKLDDRKQKQYLKDSIKKSLKWYYPLRVDAANDEESTKVRDEFIAYMADKYPEDLVSRITEAADLYENNVREAGLWLEK